MMRHFLASVPLVAAATLSPDSPDISYVGRTAAATSGNGRLLDWAGVQAVVRFSGSALSAELKGSSTGDRFLVEIDGVASKKFVVSSGPMQTVNLVEGLAEGEHTVSLWRISEDNAWSKFDGATTFGGFSLPAGGSFLAAPAQKTRRLEFWGDSNVAGWCVDGTPGGSDDPQTLVQNTYDTWAAQMARELGADFAAEAISGVGVTAQSGGGAMSGYVDGACSFSGPDWDYTTWTPDAVIFWLGLNDSHPRSKKFTAAYLSLMEHAAQKYAYAVKKPKLIHVCGSFNDSSVDACANIQEALAQFNSGRSDGFQSYYAPIGETTWNSVCNDEHFQGCDGHYNQAGHQLVSKDLLPQIRQVLGWSDGESEVVV